MVWICLSPSGQVAGCSFYRGKINKIKKKGTCCYKPQMLREISYSSHAQFFMIRKSVT